MSRPQPTVILQHVYDDQRALEVCEAEALYTVCYRGNPVKLRSFINIEIPYPGPKYDRTGFPEPGHARNLRDKLNSLFDTNDFEVYRMTPAKLIK
jgi:hypothetical protein